MKISRRRFQSMINAGLPLSAMLIAFTGLTYTTIKMVVMAAVLFLQFRRTVRAIDGALIALVFFLGVYCVAGSQSPDAEIVAYQVMTFPVFAYLLGKSFAGSAPGPRTIVVGLFAMSIALALFPARVALGDIAAAGFSGGGRSLYVDEFGAALSATVMGGLLSLGISQSAAIVSGGFKQHKMLFLVTLAAATMLLAVALRLGSRTQVMIFVLCLLFGYLLNTSGRLAMWKKIGVGIVAAALFAAAVDLLPIFLDSDLGAYFRDRMDDGRYGTSTVGGRAERWAYALESIAKQPMGWSLSGGGYAHNLWLDVARVSGWFGLFALLLFTVAHLCVVHRSLHGLRQGSVRTSLLLAVLGPNLLFMVEPIMDGFLYVFYAYCAVIGMVAGVRGRFSETLSPASGRLLHFSASKTW